MRYPLTAQFTPSVRYVSFYSWIVLSYLSADNWSAFRSFAEPAETAIALETCSGIGRSRVWWV
jgi:hypothetical protein